MIPVDQLSDAELLEILQRLDRRGMRVPLATAVREVERYRCTARAIPPNVSGTARLLDLGAGASGCHSTSACSATATSR